MSPAVRHLSSLVFLCAFALPALPGCDTQCVGANCGVEPEDSDLVVEVPEDAEDTQDTQEEEEEEDPEDIRDERDEDLPQIRSCDVVRSHAPSRPANEVQIAGSFNGWQPQPLTGPDANGWFEINLGPLGPGQYAYKYLYDGEWESEVPTSTPIQWDGGVENRQLVVPDCTKPHLEVVSASANGQGELTATVRYALGSAGDPIDASGIEVRVGSRTITPVVDTANQEITVSVSSLPMGKHTLRVNAVDTAGNAADNEIFTPLWVEDIPFEWSDGILYLIFVDRFRNGDPSTDSPVNGVAYRANYTGGDLLGLLDAIEEGWLEDLGVRSIWLSPLYQNPDSGFMGVADSNLYTGYHGYWTTEARGVESRLGDSQADAATRLHDVVDAAHERGIRVVLDVVLNHVHEQHEYITTHPDWFTDGCVCGAPGCSWDDKPIECWFTPYMPDLDHTNAEITHQMVEDTLWWLREFDLDGLRIDAVKHMHRVMTVNLRHALIEQIEEGGGAHVYTVGETFTGGGAQLELTERIGPFEMDAQFDFPFYWTIRDVFAYGSSMENLEQTIQAGIAAWGSAPMSPFAGNHDIGRLATAVSNNDAGPWGESWDRMADGGSNVTEPWLIDTITMALAATITQPGVPLLYYGDEIGLAGSGDPDNRRNMTFNPYLSGNQQALLEKVQKLGSARGGIPAIQRGDFVSLWSSWDTLAYARTHQGEVAVVAINRGDSRTLRIPMQGLWSDGTTVSDWMVSGRSATVEGGDLVIEMGGNDVAILAP